VAVGDVAAALSIVAVEDDPVTLVCTPGSPAIVDVKLLGATGVAPRLNLTTAVLARQVGEADDDDGSSCPDEEHGYLVEG